MYNKKRDFNSKIAIFFIILILLGLTLYKNPSITGRIIEGRENIFSENLNLRVNESGTYQWNMSNPGSIKSLKATGSVSTNGSAKVYIEKNGVRELIFDSTQQLFDVNINVLPEYKKILQGDEILIQIALFNLRGFGRGNIDVEYSIIDGKGNLIAAEEEKIYVETQAKFIRKLVIPSEIKPGTYKAFVEASANTNIVGTGSDTFEVMPSRYDYGPELRYYLTGLAVLAGIVIALAILVYAFRLLRKKQSIAEIRQKIPVEKTQKLEKELIALEDAFKSKFISEKSYKKDKERIEMKLGKLRKQA